ncbi:tRNA (N6-isopentenyl adenosine(37)-C2)-methylthiotransferase MiaB [Ponticaulis sp.]|uniref:tRNA (N6-isopentenyl adenosine(37)-C2)-methylthiotransferase MiaB n=1 Tax=Ponticaulis sp. TaxID=2020902 RepID=UPI00260A2BA2|nr:tRNA (N6-isopentenyl adenosine(37)-C2)-methylthiotransferase MiaB [Ponticaulis sp.]MDF1679836.1 tRNA (N6-isopentenyl adenosine(37)-C2)-methylthiotransferase MiaB [Ponticaulis sp.]
MNAATKRLFIKTYGCQMNVYDSERMKDVLAPLGYVTTETADDADLVLLNTCHIREKATEKVFSELGQLKRLKQKSGGKMLLGVTGCVAQAEGEEIMRRQPAVDLVLGPQAYHKLPEMIARVHRAANERLETDFDVEEKFDALPLDRQVDGPSAFLSVQEGCDKFCTFCVVPYTRGAEFSRNVDAIVAEARALVHKGVREINLLGQNVNAYHGDAPSLEGGDSWTLSKLIRHLAKIDGLDRIRFTTSHPRDMDDDLIEAFGDTEKLMPYLHLPIQAGSDAILKAMNRGHTAERYIEIIDRLREIRPDMAITSDFIVGFPGERDQDFEDTMKLVERIDYAAAYSFKYSRRPGTPASDMFSQVPEEVKDERLQRLQALLREQQTRFNQSQIGKTLPVLVTGKARNEGQMAGRTPYLQATHFECSEDLTGQIVNVTMNAATLNSVGGHLASKVEPVA